MVYCNVSAVFFSNVVFQKCEYRCGLAEPTLLTIFSCNLPNLFSLFLFSFYQQIIVSISLLSANPFPIYNVGSLFLKQIRFECVNHAQKLGMKLTETSFEQLLQIWFLRLLFNVTDKSVKIITKISNSLLNVQGSQRKAK